MFDGVSTPRTLGVAQGGPLSPLLANVLLDDLDKELEQRGLAFVRYADDASYSCTPDGPERGRSTDAPSVPRLQIPEAPWLISDWAGPRIAAARKAPLEGTHRPIRTRTP